MAGLNPDAFQRALERFKRSLSPDLADRFSICTLKDVRDACHDIQDKQGQEGKLRNMRRLEAFIEAMEQFGKVIEVFVNANEFVCFIWGPIKFVLNIASTYLDSFDKLLDVYAQVGEAIPGLVHYQTTFEEHPPLTTVLEDYYSDILVFHQAALSVFKRPKWKDMFHSTWKTFDTKFSPILHSLRSRRKLLESEKGSATLYEIHSLRRKVSAMQKEQKQQMIQKSLDKHKTRLRLVREKLQAPNYQIDQEIATEVRQGYTSGAWIFENPDFQAWSGDGTTDHGVLYVNGIPGAGKTILMSAVIEKLLDQNRSGVDKHCVAYFYFKHNEPDKETYNSLLRAVLDQLIDQDPDISDRLFPDISPIEGTGLRSTKALEKLVKLALESYQLSYVILDGLDECTRGEAAKSLKWFLSLVDGGLENTTAVLRVLFCGQRDGVLDKLLVDKPSISLDTSSHAEDGHKEDIKRYCGDVCEQIREKFNISSETANYIASTVAKEARGMFLYARVVLGNLLGQTKLSGLTQEIDPSTFPRGIEKAYERVAVRVFEKSSPAEREDATKILGWITCARRLLRWREIQSLFCIDPLTGSVDYEGSRLRVTCKDLCGSLVDVHHTGTQKAGPEDIITIVHDTARGYLIQRSYLNTCHSHAKLAIFCSRYLTSNPFALEIDDKDVSGHAIRGYYALQDYAVQYWFDHFREYLDSAKISVLNLFEEAMESAQHFLISYGLPLKIDQHDGPRQHNEVARTLRELPQDGNERNAYFSVEFRTSAIRKRIENIQEDVLDPAVREALTSLHGTTALFKCSKPWCEFFTAGFESIEHRKQHTYRHELPFFCPVEDCLAFKLGYDTQSKLQTHTKHHHPKPDDRLEFPKISNGKGKSSIWAAIEKGDLAKVQTLLDSGFPIKKPRSGSGYPPLYEAVKHGCLDICKVLIERGASISNTGAYGVTALHLAVRAGDLDIARLLVKDERCHPDATDRFGVSPFCEACALGHLGIVKLLFEEGKVDMSARPKSHPECCKGYSATKPLTPLGYACSEGHLPVVQYLLQLGQPDFSQGEYLAWAAHRGHSAVVDVLLVEIAASPRLILQAIQTSHKLLPPEAVLAANRSPDSWLHEMKQLVNLLLPAVTRCVDLLLLAIVKSPDSLQQLPDLLLPVFRKLPYVLTPAIEKSSTIFLPLIEKSFDKFLPMITLSPMIRRNISPPAHIKMKESWFAVFNENYPRLLDVELVHTLSHESAVWCVKFSHCGKYIATGADEAVHIYDTTLGGKLYSLQHERRPTCISFSPDSRYLAMGTTDGYIMVWHIATQMIRKMRDCSPKSILSLDFSQDGRVIAFGTSSGTVRRWEFEQDIDMLTFTLADFGDVASVAVSSDAKLVAACHKNGIFGIWNALSGTLLRQLGEDSFDQNWDQFFLTFSLDSSKLLISGLGGFWFETWDTFKGGRVGSFGECFEHVTSAAITSDSNWILSASHREVRLRDQRTGLSQLVLQGHADIVNSIATNPTGNLFATLCINKEVRIWSYRPASQTGSTANPAMNIGTSCQ